MKMKTSTRRGRLFFRGGGGDDAAQPMVGSIPTPPSPPSGPMTRARAKALHDKVNSLLSMLDLDSTLDGMLLHSNTLCIIRYEPSRLHMEGNPRTCKHGEEGREEEEEESQLGEPQYYRPEMRTSTTARSSTTTRRDRAVLPPTAKTSPTVPRTRYSRPPRRPVLPLGAVLPLPFDDQYYRSHARACVPDWALTHVTPTTHFTLS